MTDAAQPTFQHRIADLLDDVTEATEPVAAQPPTVAPAATPNAPAGSANVGSASVAGVPTPAAPVPPLDDTPALPPFLIPRSLQAPPAAPPSAGPEQRSSLPGTSLFANSAARAAAKAEQSPPPPTTAAAPALNGEQPATAANNAAASDATASDATATLETAATNTAKAVSDAAAGAAATAAPVTTAPPGPPISIKGRADGLVVEIGKGSWSEILAALDDRLQQSASFFRNARVAVDLGGRAATEAELTPLVDLLKAHGLTPGAIRTSTERAFQAALALGLTTTLESAEGAPVADAAQATTNITTGAYFVYRGYLRSGHRLHRQESILVIGDINPGAEVSSEGDVLVWGRLRGVVHAGAKGNNRAIVAALDMEPTQLRIADVMTIGPDPRPGQPGKWFWRRSATKRPEIARLVDDAIALEEWDAARPGGLVSLRRGG
jgi:septum site-determining protein MinC